jgi:hypothetical protein
MAKKRHPAEPVSNSLRMLNGDGTFVRATMELGKELQ